MTYADRMWSRLRSARLPERHHHIAITVALILDADARLEQVGYATSDQVARATGINRGTCVAKARELERDNLIKVERRGAAYVFLPGPALTHPTEGEGVANLLDRIPPSSPVRKPEPAA